MEQSYAEDLRRLYNALRKHPLFIREPEQAPYFDALYQALHSPKSFASLVDSATVLTVFFQDGHTNIELPYLKTDLCLPIPCRWEGNRLILAESYLGISAGAEISAVEGMSVSTLVTAMCAYIPHENLYLVKSRMVNYPYKNYHLFSEFTLNRLFSKKSSYQVTFLQESSSTATLCNLVPYNGFLSFSDTENFIRYQISDQVAYLMLDACIENEKFHYTLKTLAEECRNREIKTLVLDLSKNMGGSSAVIDELISYIDIDSYCRYEMINYSSGIPQTVTDRTVRIQNHKQPILFPPNIICKVSHNTFSSARTLAVTLKDNRIAKIIGDPTGGKPSSFGMPQKGVLPQSGIRYRVSQCIFLRPDITLDRECSLYPDFT